MKLAAAAAARRSATATARFAAAVAAVMAPAKQVAVVTAAATAVAAGIAATARLGSAAAARLTAAARFAAAVAALVAVQPAKQMAMMATAAAAVAAATGIAATARLGRTTAARRGGTARLATASLLAARARITTAPVMERLCIGGVQHPNGAGQHSRRQHNTTFHGRTPKQLVVDRHSIAPHAPASFLFPLLGERVRVRGFQTRRPPSQFAVGLKAAAAGSPDLWLDLWLGIGQLALTV